MKEFIANYKKFRYFLFELVKKDIKLKYRSSVLGLLWTLIEPLLTMIVLVLVFSNILGKGDDNFKVYILCGRLLYSFFSNGTKTAMKSVRKHSSMISKVYVPKYMYPLASVLSNYVIFMISQIVLVGVIIFEGVSINIHIIDALIPLVLIFVLTFGVGMLLATLNVFFRDLEYLWTVILMLIMYTSAIFYKVESMANTSNMWIFKINPLYSLITLFRDAVFGRGFAEDMYHLWYSMGLSFVVAVVGIVFFARKQDRFILYI